MYEAEQRGLSAELAVYEREDSPMLDALIGQVASIALLFATLADRFGVGSAEQERP
ncbi:hypothetical protein [Streptomyces sp. NPDC058812]|uniref:hypothetical protein n=1 Tax=unclassified Streptomyces TaxID=2593676 RepID=UPI00367C834E